MPPKCKFEKKEIIQAAFEIVLSGGWKALSARSVALRLKASSKPIYGHYKCMSELEEDVVRKAVNLLFEYMIQPRTQDPWHDHGIGYVLFGMREKNLFLALNHEGHIGHFRRHGQKIWDACSGSLLDYSPFAGMTPDQIHKIQFLRWLLAHGLAWQAAVQPPGLFDESLVVELIRDGSEALLDGLKKQFINAPNPTLKKKGVPHG